jgi:predicted dehydrogenase
MKDRWFSKKAIAGGGTLMDTSVHSIDVFRFLVGEVVEQKAVMHRHMPEIDVEDASILTLKAENGALGALTASWVAGEGQAIIDVTGQSGRVVYDYMKPDEVRLKRLGEKEWERIAVQPSNGFAEEIAIFLAAIRGEGDLICTAGDGLRAIEIIEANY